MNFSTVTADVESANFWNSELEALNRDIETMVIAPNTIEKVKIMDAEGNVMMEILKSDFNTNRMSIDEHLALSSSEFMFDYLGDAYYILD
jgi:hypothetical protein